MAALPEDRVDGRAVDQADGRVVREDDHQEGAGHAAEAAADGGTDRAGEYAPSRLRE